MLPKSILLYNGPQALILTSKMPTVKQEMVEPLASLNSLGKHDCHHVTVNSAHHDQYFTYIVIADTIWKKFQTQMGEAAARIMPKTLNLSLTVWLKVGRSNQGVTLPLCFIRWPWHGAASTPHFLNDPLSHGQTHQAIWRRPVYHNRLQCVKTLCNISYLWLDF